MRVLAMAGSLASVEILKFQTAQLRQGSGKDVEWALEEGTYLHPISEELLPTMLSPIELQLVAKRKKIFSWYEDIYRNGETGHPLTAPPGGSMKEHQFNPSVRVESVDIPEKVRLLRTYLEENGPFDVIVAFSQACMMVHYLVGHLRQEGIEWMP